jgi:hypothetical protein
MIEPGEPASFFTSTRSDMSSRPFDDYRDTPLWTAIESTIRELTASKEISVNTAPDYVIGYLCRELAAKKVIDASGLEH